MTELKDLVPKAQTMASAWSGQSAADAGAMTAGGEGPVSLARRGLRGAASVAGVLLAEAGALLVLLALWQLWIWAGDVDALVMPSPAAVLGDIFGNPGAYLPETMTTLRAALSGLLFGLVLGVALAILSWWSTILRGLITPPVMLVRSVPMMAMIPIFARIVGYNGWTVVVVSTLVAYFPAYILTLSGLSSAGAASRDLFTVLGSRRREVLRHLALPAAIPSALTALRLASVACVVGALIAEYVASTNGLGYLFIRTRLDYQIDRSWGVALTATLLSVVMFGIASSIERVGRRRMQ